LKLIKDFGLGAMTIFASLFAITATAMLIPRDIEDRTLYTVLCKPVTRMEYLLGKYVGVVALVGLSLLFMYVLFSGVLYARQSMILAEQEELLRESVVQLVGEDREALIEESIAGMREAVARQGLTWNLQWGIYAVFLKACVIAALALLISTFASSTLFTIIVGVVAFFVGHVQADVRAFYESAEATEWIARALAVPVALLFPDFQLFNIVDAAAMGELVSGDVLMRMSVLATAYVLVYLSLAWVFFHAKEL
jgi:ABC-type Na+ efflux pump permease subunit